MTRLSYVSNRYHCDVAMQDGATVCGVCGKDPKLRYCGRCNRNPLRPRQDFCQQCWEELEARYPRPKPFKLKPHDA